MPADTSHNTTIDTQFLGRNVEDASSGDVLTYTGSSYAEWQAPTGGSSLAVMVRAWIATDAGHDFSNFQDYPFEVVWGDPDAEAPDYNASRHSVSVVANFTDVTTQKVRPFFSLTGGPMPAIPAAWQAILTGFGADPADEWDLSGIAMDIQALTGTDAGHHNLLELDRSAHLPPDGFLDIGVKGLVFTSPDHGGADLTVSINGTTGEITLPSNGVYSVTLTPNIDFFYP